MNEQIAGALRSQPSIQEGVDRRIVCPSCGPGRKPVHRNEKTLSFKRDGDTILYHCHHCDESGAISGDTARLRTVRAVERQPEVEHLSREAVGYLKGRKIPREVAERYGVKSCRWRFGGESRSREALMLPYLNGDTVYASKIRSLEDKKHSSAGACETLFGLDQLGDLDRIVIAEGEFDALALAAAGVGNALSVPNGAINKPMTHRPNEASDAKFRFLWNAKELLAQVDKVYLAGDMDAPGEIMTNEIARRVGRHKCWRVRWPAPYKDANDVLINLGPEAVVEAVEAATPFPVSGLFRVEDFAKEVEDLYVNGVTGVSCGYNCVDPYFTVVPGSLNVMTGIPSSGKSEFIDQIAVNLAARRDWNVAVASFENDVESHVAKLVQKRTGKHFFPGPTARMTREELKEGMTWVNDHFSFISQRDGSMLPVEEIIERLRVSVIRYGIKMAVIDPVNYIDRDLKNVSETEWVSNTLTKFRMFAQAYDVALFLVAHPKMLTRESGRYSIPTGYDISGSAHWYNKADFGLTVHRDKDEDTDEVMFRVWKSRWSWCGKEGDAVVRYNTRTTRYEEADWR